MGQRNRPGGNEGIGYFTSWDKSREKGCIYCGKPATTREHIPSKAFLIEPYPEDLATLPACFECNNGFSNNTICTLTTEYPPSETILPR